MKTIQLSGSAASLRSVGTSVYYAPDAVTTTLKVPASTSPQTATTTSTSLSLKLCFLRILLCCCDGDKQMARACVSRKSIYFFCSFIGLAFVGSAWYISLPAIAWFAHSAWSVKSLLSSGNL